MPRRPSRTVPTVLLAGPNGEQDWPHWLADQLRSAGRTVHTCFVDDPAAAWQVDLAAAMITLPDGGFDLVAHSVGCLLWLHWAAGGTGSARPARVALVAPPDATGAPAGWAGLFPVPLDIDAVRQAAGGTALVGSDNDPHCATGIAQAYGAPLKMAVTLVPGAGGFTVADGYGTWPAVLDWCGRDNLAFIA